MRSMLDGISRNAWRGLRHLIIRSVKLVSSAGSRAGNFVQSIGYRTDQLFYTFAGGGGDGMKLKLFPLAKIS
jgi:hypothetical protein